jgi:hypothetical protein
MPKILVFVILLFQLVFVIDSHHTTNRVAVYYESICPDSRKFILNQLIPTYDKLSQYMDIDLIPFGNANVSYPNYDFKPFFQCQHGPDECYGNKAQACVIDLTKSTRPSLNYIKCMFAADNWRETKITAQKVSKQFRVLYDSWSPPRHMNDSSVENRFSFLFIPILYLYNYISIENTYRLVHRLLIANNKANKMC